MRLKHPSSSDQSIIVLLSTFQGHAVSRIPLILRQVISLLHFCKLDI